MPAMSLFNEAVLRVSQLEEELKIANERIRNLEVALKSARQDKMRAMGASGYIAKNATTVIRRLGWSTIELAEPDSIWRHASKRPRTVRSTKAPLDMTFGITGNMRARSARPG